MARSLLARRDVAAFNNLRDPQTGVDWYTAGTALEKLRQAGVPIADVPSMLPSNVSQYFQNMFPSGSFPNFVALLNDFEAGGITYDPNWTNAQAVRIKIPMSYFTANDWTDTQAEIGSPWTLTACRSCLHSPNTARCRPGPPSAQLSCPDSLSGKSSAA
jgi:hypothetical protein